MVCELTQNECKTLYSVMRLLHTLEDILDQSKMVSHEKTLHGVYFESIEDQHIYKDYVIEKIEDLDKLFISCGCYTVQTATGLKALFTEPEVKSKKK